MRKIFVKLYDSYIESTTIRVKGSIRAAMVSFAKACLKEDTSFDMDMYTTLYKCARTSKQRKQALEFIYQVIINPSLRASVLLDQFKEFMTLNAVLYNDDEFEFDIICCVFLDRLNKKYDECCFGLGAGMGDFIPEISPGVARAFLKKAIYNIHETERHLEACKLADEYSKRLWKKMAVRIFHSLFHFIEMLQIISIL